MRRESEARRRTHFWGPRTNQTLSLHHHLQHWPQTIPCPQLPPERYNPDATTPPHRPGPRSTHPPYPTGPGHHQTVVGNAWSSPPPLALSFSFVFEATGRLGSSALASLYKIYLTHTYHRSQILQWNLHALCHLGWEQVESYLGPVLTLLPKRGRIKTPSQPALFRILTQ